MTGAIGLVGGVGAAACVILATGAVPVGVVLGLFILELVTNTRDRARL